jgi:hypothetical protein
MIPMRLRKSTKIDFIKAVPLSRSAARRSWKRSRRKPVLTFNRTLRGYISERSSAA